MIALSNGHNFEFQCASGALGFDGLGYFWEKPLRWLKVIDTTKFTVVAKTVTTNPRKGNLSMLHPWTCVRLLKHGTVNCVGLSNPGIERWADHYYPRTPHNIAASIMTDSWEDAFALGSFLDPLNLMFVELNVSCPNTEHKLSEKLYKTVKGFKAACHHPIIVKLSSDQTKDQALVEQLAMDEIEAIHAINTVPWNDIFPDKLKSKVVYQEDIFMNMRDKPSEH